MGSLADHGLGLKPKLIMPLLAMTSLLGGSDSHSKKSWLSELKSLRTTSLVLLVDKRYSVAFAVTHYSTTAPPEQLDSPFQFSPTKPHNFCFIFWNVGSLQILVLILGPSSMLVFFNGFMSMTNYNSQIMFKGRHYGEQVVLLLLCLVFVSTREVIFQ